MIISIEGADRVGKDSFLLALDKKTRWATSNIMRGPAGCLTYDEIYNRLDAQRYYEAISSANAIKSNRHLIIYLYASEEVIKKRLEEEKEQGGSGYFGPWDIQKTLSLYKKNIEFLYDEDEVLYLDSGELTIEEEVEKAYDRILEILNSDFQLIKSSNFKNVKSPNKGQFEYVQYRPYVHTYQETELNTLKPFDRTIDAPYYDMLEKVLDHKLYEYELGWINDRQIVYTSNDCISMIQILLGDVIEVFVHQRSCDIEKHKTNDITFFRDYLQHRFNKNIIIHYSCAVPHKYLKKD